MKIYLRISVFIIGIILSSFFSGITNAQSRGVWKITLEIKRWFLTIDWSGSINIWAISSIPTSEERIIPIDNVLHIRDASWLCGNYYTTIQSSNLSYTTHTISNIRANITNINTVAGKVNNILSIGTAIDNKQGNIKIPKTYIQRPSGEDCLKIGQYSSDWNIHITIPANQTAGNYRWKLYYLLIDNN